MRFVEVSFPKLGLGPWQFDGVAFSLFGVDVAWYGLLITMGMVLAFFFGLWQAKKVGIKTDDVIDLAILTVLFSITGARLMYVLFPPEGVSFLATNGTLWENIKQTFINVISIREGGLSIIGGVFGGFMAGLVISKWKKIRFPMLLDILSPCVMIGQIIGRWGNFINGEAFGSVTGLPWGMKLNVVTEYEGLGIIKSPIERGFDVNDLFHPTFFYESMWNLLGFALIMIFHKKKKFHGQIFAFYLIWYGAGRAVIESLRTDSMLLFGLKFNQMIGILLVLIGIIIMVLGHLKINRNIDVMSMIGKKVRKMFPQRNKDTVKVQRKSKKAVLREKVKGTSESGAEQDGEE